MKREEIEAYHLYYYNTTGAYGVPISQEFLVIDKGENFIWGLPRGNMGVIPVKPEDLSTKALYVVTNSGLPLNIDESLKEDYK